MLWNVERQTILSDATRQSNRKSFLISPLLDNIRFWFEKSSRWSLHSSKDRHLTVYNDIQTLRILLAPKQKGDIILARKDIMLVIKLTNRMYSLRIEAKLIHNIWTWSIYRTKKSFYPLCFNIHFPEETINGSHITITTATLRLCTNYTPDLCNVFCNLIGNKLKKYLNYSEKEPSKHYIILSRHSKILFP